VYAKLFTSIYQGTLRGNSHGLLVFTNLLAHCDKLGEVDMHPRAIAEEVGLSVDQVRAALLVLESPDDESRSPEEQGRRILRKDEHRDWGWRVVNYLKYRAIRDEDDRREQNRLAQEKWRNKNKPASAAVVVDKPIQKQKQKHIQKTLSKPAASHPAKRGSVGDDGFELFWQACPRKIAKGAARKAWKKICPSADLLDTIVAAMRDQATWDAWIKDSGQFIPHPATWLNAERWTDVRPVVGRPGAAVTAPSDEAAKTAAYLAQQEQERAGSVIPADFAAKARAVKAAVAGYEHGVCARTSE
jgi:hypothetical protein